MKRPSQQLDELCVRDESAPYYYDYSAGLAFWSFQIISIISLFASLYSIYCCFLIGGQHGPQLECGDLNDAGARTARAGTPEFRDPSL